jgi:hypothetical protein
MNYDSEKRIDSGKDTDTYVRKHIGAEETDAADGMDG